MQFNEVIDLLEHNRDWETDKYDKWILLGWHYFLKHRQNDSYIPQELMSKIHGILSLMRDGVDISIKQRYLLAKSLCDYQTDIDPMKAYY